MPGFNISSSDSGSPNAQHEFLRKHRWRMSSWLLGDEDWVYLKSASRPKVTIDQMIMHHRNDRAHFAGRIFWDPITVEFYDNIKVSSSLYKILDGKVYGLIGSDVVGLSPSIYKKTNAILNLLDGGGNTIEEWKLYNFWPYEVDWGDLDYSSNELATVKVSFKFDRAELVSTEKSDGPIDIIGTFSKFTPEFNADNNRSVSGQLYGNSYGGPITRQ